MKVVVIGVRAVCRGRTIWIVLLRGSEIVPEVVNVVLVYYGVSAVHPRILDTFLVPNQRSALIELHPRQEVLIIPLDGLELSRVGLPGTGCMDKGGWDLGGVGALVNRNLGV